MSEVVPLADQAAAWARLGAINARAYLAAYQGNEPEPLRMGIAARAVAAEVLKDPAHWAHALGLPDPVSHLSVAVTTPPERCDQCGKIAPHYRRMTTTQGWVVCGLWQCKACAEKTDTTFVAGLG